MVGAALKRRAVIIGTGFMGRVHLEAIRRVGSIDVHAVCGSSFEKARTFANAFGVERAEADYRKAVEDPSVDVVHVCTPNMLHAPVVLASLRAGKHVVCEKPLATTTESATELVSVARETGRRNCTCHNLRYYPMVQQMRRMRENGELGQILVAQGTYSQDWLLHRSDWNWRVDRQASGPLRAMADIGSHWCDMVEHVTGQRLTSVCADLATFHTTRERTGDRADVQVDTEDFGAVLFRLGDVARGAFTASQVSAGCKNRLSVEIYGTIAGVAWNQERPDELWVGRRDAANEIVLKDPALLKDAARPYADLPGGHSEGYGDTFKQVFRRFYDSVDNPVAQIEYPQFEDGLRQMRILDAELASHRLRGWVDVG